MNAVLKQIKTLEKTVASSVQSPVTRSKILDAIAQAKELSSGRAVDKGGLAVGKPTPPKKKQKTASKKPKAKKKIKQKDRAWVPKKGDIVSASPTIFDGGVPGQFSDAHPERCFGVVQFQREGVSTVRWIEDDDVCSTKNSDLRLERSKPDIETILVFLVEGKQVAFEHLDRKEWPDDFLSALIKSDWRDWVQSVKKEVGEWLGLDVYELVDISSVPPEAKIVPLGELYTRKRDASYKFRQYLMGNLLREGIDFVDTFSTNIANTSVCFLYSVATAANKEVRGADAVCGFLQAMEQFKLYSFLPSHEGFSRLSYEELGELRIALLDMVKTKGIDSLKQLSRKLKRESRTKPKQVYRFKKSVYGGSGAGHSFQMLVVGTHKDKCGMTQCQVDPCVFVKISVDQHDIVQNYLMAGTFADDFRYFGTDQFIIEYEKTLEDFIKVKFIPRPVREFISIETTQDLERGLTILNMPKYFEAALRKHGKLWPKGLKRRGVPITVADQKVVETAATEAEYEEAKHLPFLELLGTCVFPASMCKFEMKMAVSMLGSCRQKWSTTHFEILKKCFEYGYETKEIGLVYSKGLDPHGDNVPYAWADAAHSVPRSRGCHIIQMNGAAIKMETKKHSLSASSTVMDEFMQQFEGSTSIGQVRNLMAEVGLAQQEPTDLYQDNSSTVQISMNRGSLSDKTKSIALKFLVARNRIEDWEYIPKLVATEEMLADMGTKAMPEADFVRFRDLMNGYSLVRAAYPDLSI